MIFKSPILWLLESHEVLPILQSKMDKNLPQSDFLASKPSLCDPVEAFLKSTHQACLRQTLSSFISAGQKMRPEATEVKPNHLQTYQIVQLFSTLLTAQRVQKFTNSFLSHWVDVDAGYWNSVKKPEKQDRWLYGQNEIIGFSFQNKIVFCLFFSF